MTTHREPMETWTTQELADFCRISTWTEAPAELAMARDLLHKRDFFYIVTSREHADLIAGRDHCDTAEGARAVVADLIADAKLAAGHLALEVAIHHHPSLA